MRRLLILALLAAIVAVPAAAQEAAAPALEGPWWARVLYFIVSLPYTLYVVFVDGQRMHLLPAPLLGAAVTFWSFREWRRQRYWTPRVIHVMAALALATILAINVAWLSAGGAMVTQRYVVIAIFGLFPYVAYLLFLGPKYLGRKRAPQRSADEMTFDAPAPLAGAPQPKGTGLLYAVFGAGALGVVLIAGVVGASVVVPAFFGPDYEGLENPQALVPGARGVEKGDPEAQVTVVVFEDYQCPACGAFATRHQRRVEEAYLDSGRARFVYYDLPLTSIHANAFLAARSAHCAEDQDLFWEYHDELYRRQETWSPLADPTIAFAEYAATVGMNVDDFRACLSSARHADLVRANDELASALGVSSTPSILVRVEGARIRRSPAYDFETVARTIDQVVASAAR